MPTLLHPPIDIDAFLEEVFRDSEYTRRSAGGVTYARGRHAGYDMQRRGHPDALYAVRDGIIRTRSFGPAFGLQMTLVLPNGYGWFYAHCQTILRDGTHVRAGQKIGRMGTTGGVQEHLHFEGRRDWREWTTAENIGDDLRDLQRLLRAGEKPWVEEDWFDMATKAELEEIVQREVSTAVTALARIILERFPSRTRGMTDDQVKMIEKAIATAAKQGR